VIFKQLKMGIIYSQVLRMGYSIYLLQKEYGGWRKAARQIFINTTISIVILLSCASFLEKSVLLLFSYFENGLFHL